MTTKKIPSFLLLLLGGLWFSQCQAPKSVSYQQLKEGHWSTVAIADNSLPEKRHEAAFVGLGDRFYLLGGRGMKPSSIYDTKTNTWQKGAVPPIELHHFQPVVFQEEIYILGAMTGRYPGETPVPDIYIYNPKEDRWRKDNEIPADRRRGGAGAVLYKDHIYLLCGIKDGHRGDHKKWLDVYDPRTGLWEKLPDAPRPRDHFQAIVAEDKLYSLAGRTTTASDNPFKNTIAEVDVYDFETQNWSTLPNGLPTLRAGNAAICLGREILVLGGESFTQEAAHSEVEALHIGKGAWRMLPSLSKGRHGTGVILHQGQLYMSSGSGNRGGGPELEDLIRFSF